VAENLADHGDGLMNIKNGYQPKDIDPPSKTIDILYYIVLAIPFLVILIRSKSLRPEQILLFRTKVPHRKWIWCLVMHESDM